MAARGKERVKQLRAGKVQVRSKRGHKRALEVKEILLTEAISN